MTLFYLSFEYIFGLLEFLLLYMFFSSIFQKYDRLKSYWYFLVIFGMSITVFLMSSIQLYSVYKSIISTILMILYSFLFDTTIKNRFFYSFMFIAVQVLCELTIIQSTIYFLGNTSDKLIMNMTMDRIVLTFIIKTVMFILLKLISESVTRTNEMLPKKYWFLVFGLFIITTINMLVVFDMSLKIKEESQTSLYLVFMCASLLMIDIVVYTMFVKLNTYYYNQQIANMTAMQYKATEQHFIAIKLYNDEMRKIHHDFNNHIQCMTILIQNQKNEDLIDYIFALKEGYERIPTIIRTGNEIVDAVLNQKKVQAEQNHIDFQVKAVVSPDMKINSTDLSALLFNSLDNAIEANLKIANKDQRMIKINIAPKKGYLYIDVTNSMVTSKNFTFQTSKSDKKTHGLGLKIMKNITKKYNGDIHHKIEDDVVILSIAIEIL